MVAPRAFPGWSPSTCVCLLTPVSLPPVPRQEFVQLAKRLVSDPALEREIVANGREYVRACHSWQAERCTYQNLIRTLEGSIQD